MRARITHTSRKAAVMPRGASVIEYHGKRGVVYRVKYVDSLGTQVQETIGAERDGVTRIAHPAKIHRPPRLLARVEPQRPSLTHGNAPLRADSSTQDLGTLSNSATSAASSRRSSGRSLV
jgi:hypothetical protein